MRLDETHIGENELDGPIGEWHPQCRDVCPTRDNYVNVMYSTTMLVPASTDLLFDDHGAQSVFTSFWIGCISPVLKHFFVDEIYSRRQ